MHIKYHTGQGSIYTHTIEGSRDYWMKEDKDGRILPLAEGLHISKQKLQTLLREYPSAVLDKTYCFDDNVEREFFDDVKHKQSEVSFETEETVIFFIVKKQPGLHSIGCSSRVVKIEKVE
jgi:hypothetical protein